MDQRTRFGGLCRESLSPDGLRLDGLSPDGLSPGRLGVTSAAGSESQARRNDSCPHSGTGSTTRTTKRTHAREIGRLLRKYEALA
jgi:hypothetical protein